MFPRRTATTLLLFCLISSGLYVSFAALESRSGSAPGQAPSVSELARSVLAGAAEAAQPLPVSIAGSGPAPEPSLAALTEAEQGEVDRLLEAPEQALDAFYGSLLKTEARGEGALTRVLHWGDSMLTGDAISGAVRATLQKRFGDGGHGFILAGRPWPWYHHRGASSWSSDGFRINRITANPLGDGQLGLGAVAFRTFQGGARFNVGPEEGEQVDRYELFYLEHPRGGDLSLQLEGRPEVSLSTKGPRATSRSYSVPAGEGSPRLTVVYTGNGEVRLFGVALERSGPGLVYDSLGVNGLHAANFRRYSPQHLAEQVKQRSPALLVVMLGTNESQNQDLDLTKHGEDYGQMLDLLRRGAPEASCLVVSPPDRASRGYQSSELISRIVATQREVAFAKGCAFWNTFQAMGGAGSAARWRRMQPPLVGGDLIHPTPLGAERLGSMLARALLDGFDRWKQARPPVARALDSGAPDRVGMNPPSAGAVSP